MYISKAINDLNDEISENVASQDAALAAGCYICIYIFSSLNKYKPTWQSWENFEIAFLSSKVLLCIYNNQLINFFISYPAQAVKADERVASN